MANDKSRSQGLWIKCPIAERSSITERCRATTTCARAAATTSGSRPICASRCSSTTGRYKKFFGKIRSADPLGFVDSKPYSDRLKVYNKKFNGSDAVVVAQGEINKIPTVIAAMEYGFMGGSMGSAVGEKLTRAIERCVDRKLPLIIVSCSGGARMQEGILSLMQLGKVSAGLARMRAKRSPVHLGAHRSDHGRRDRELRDARRPQHRRTGSADRFCRSAGDRTDHPPDAAGRLPAIRVSRSSTACSTWWFRDPSSRTPSPDACRCCAEARAARPRVGSGPSWTSCGGSRGTGQPAAGLSLDPGCRHQRQGIDRCDARGGAPRPTV